VGLLAWSGELVVGSVMRGCLRRCDCAAGRQGRIVSRVVASDEQVRPRQERGPATLR